MRKTCFSKTMSVLSERSCKECFGNAHAEASKYCRSSSRFSACSQTFCQRRGGGLLWPTTVMMETRRDARAIVLHAYTYIDVVLERLSDHTIVPWF